jgi:hypothetical protein
VLARRNICESEFVQHFSQELGSVTCGCHIRCKLPTAARNYKYSDYDLDILCYSRKFNSSHTTLWSGMANSKQLEAFHTYTCYDERYHQRGLKFPPETYVARPTLHYNTAPLKVPQITWKGTPHVHPSHSTHWATRLPSFVSSRNQPTGMTTPSDLMVIHTTRSLVSQTTTHKNITTSLRTGVASQKSCRTSRLSSTSQTHGNNINHCLTERSRRFLLLEEAPCASDTVVTPVT